MSEQQKPAGYKVVPIEPTPEMISAFAKKFNVRRQQETFAAAVVAMLAAPPAPSVPAADLVRDAERYRWLRAYNTAKHPAVTGAFFLGEERLDAEIDAVIAAEKGDQP